MKVKEMKVKPTSYRTWIVTDEDEEYRVSLDGDKYLCECDRFTLLKTECGHIQLIKHLMEEERGDNIG